MQQVKLDAIDMAILALLQSNGRITNVELSRRVGISAPPCLRRVRALEEAGYILGYHGVIDEEALGFEFSFFAMVSLGSQNDTVLESFKAMINDWPEVRQSWMMSGEVDFILRCVTRDKTAFEAMTHRLTSVPNVAMVRTALIHDIHKDAPGVPIDAEFVADVDTQD